MSASEHEAAKAKCPKCGSKKVYAVPGRVYVVTKKLTTGNINIMKGPPSGQGPFAFAAAGATTLVRATRY